MGYIFNRHSILLLSIIVLVGLGLTQFNWLASAQTPSRVTLTTNQWARGGDFAVEGRNRFDTSNHDKLYKAILRIQLTLADGYQFLTASAGVPVGGETQANYRISLVRTQAECTNYNQPDGSRNPEDGGFTPTPFFSTTDTYRIYRNSQVTATNHALSGVNAGSSGHHRAQLSSFNREGVYLSAGYRPCVEVVYRSRGNTQPLYEYLSGDMIQTRGAYASYAFLHPATLKTATTGTKLTIRVRFSDAMQLLPLNQINIVKRVRPYLRVKSNQPGYDKDWIFRMDPWTSNSSHTVDFSRHVEFGDEIIRNSESTYRFNNAQLIEDVTRNNVRLHFGGFYIVNSHGLLPDRYFLREKVSIHSVAEQPVGSNIRSETRNVAPDYYMTIPASRLDAFDVAIDTKLAITVERNGQTLVAKVLPVAYTANQVTKSTIKGNSWNVRVSSDTNRPRKACSAESTRYNGVITKVADGRAGIDLPARISQHWYCFSVNDAKGRVVDSQWIAYVGDTTPPTLTFTTADNQIRISFTDAGSGILSGSFGWFLMPTAEASCSSNTPQATFTNVTTSLPIRADLHQRYLCARVTDNAGNVTVKKVQFMYMSAEPEEEPVITEPETTRTPVDQPTDKKTTDKKVTKPTDKKTTKPTTTTEKATKPQTPASPVTVNTDIVKQQVKSKQRSKRGQKASYDFLPSNWHNLSFAAKVDYWDSNRAIRRAWADLTTAQKIALNPFNCQPRKIRADNARCLNGQQMATPATDVTINEMTTETESVDDEVIVEPEEVVIEEAVVVEPEEVVIADELLEDEPVEVVAAPIVQPVATAPAESTARSFDTPYLVIAVVGGAVLGAGVVALSVSHKKKKE